MNKPKTEETSRSLDETDRTLMGLLQRNCRLSISELANRLHVSQSACHRRIKRLESAGFIEGYVAKLCPTKLGYSIELFVEVSLTTQSEEMLLAFEQAVRSVPEVLECHLMGGQSDYLLRIVAEDMGDYDRIHRKSITRLPGIAKIQTSFALRTIKSWSGYPLDPV